MNITFCAEHDSPQRSLSEHANGFKDEPLVKIITGMRRCGKSTLMEMFMNDLKENGISEKDIVYMNFEDPLNVHIKDGDMLLKEVMVATEFEQGTYLFFDDIQDLNGWEKAINSMRYSGADVYIAGSNAKRPHERTIKKLAENYRC